MDGKEQLKVCPVKFLRRNIKKLANGADFVQGIQWTPCDRYVIIWKCDLNGLRKEKERMNFVGLLFFQQHFYYGSILIF